MSRSDLIADAFAMIRNAAMVNKETVNIPASNMLLSIMEILKREDYIKDFKKIEDNKQGVIRIHLKFNQNGQPAISGLRKISKSGLRVYVRKDKIPYVLRGLGTAVISTSKGIITDRDAKKMGVGGEVVCYVW